MSSTYLSKHGYVIKKDFLTPEKLLELKSELIARPLQDHTFQTENTSYPVYIETKNKLYIPRKYGIEKFGKPDKELKNYKGESTTRDLKFLGELRTSQLIPYNKLKESCLQNGGGVLQLHTGGGKTFLGIKLISELKKKTLIIVNKIPLMEQWRSEITQFLPDAKIGIIQGQKSVSTFDCDVVLGMLQSLSQIDYPDSLFEDFGCVIVDEIHNISSKVFSKVLFKITAQFMIGLSATPERSDGLSYVYKWHLGDIIYKSVAKRDGLHPIIQTYKLHSNKYVEHSTTNRFTGQKQIQFTQMLTDLTNMPTRNTFILNLLQDLISDGRKILILSDRRQHLVNLELSLKKRKVSFTFGLFLGQMKLKDLEQSKRADVILATYKAFGEGVSERDLDTLILTTPKKFIGHLKHSGKKEAGSLEQIVGRIFRKDHTTLHPLIIDIQDQFSIFKNQALQRMVFYRSHFKTFRLEEFKVNEGTVEGTKNVFYHKKYTEENETQNSTDKLSNKLASCCIDDE